MGEQQKLFIDPPALLSIKLITENDSFPVPIRTQEYASLFYVKEGYCTGMNDHASYALKSGEVLLIHPRSEMKLHAADSLPLKGILVSIGIHINGRSKGSLVEQEGRPVLALGIERQAVENYLETIRREFENFHLGSSEMISSSLQSLAVILIRQWERPHQANTASLGQLVKGYIEAHFEKELTLAELAKLVHVSPHHLAHVFKDETGMAPIRYVIHCRIEEAKKLLTSTDMKVYEIAERIGYPNLTHFNQIFKKMSGLSPREFRKSRDNRKG